MHVLEPRRISSRKLGGYLLELEARPGRIGIAMDDPNQVGLVRLAELAGHLHGDPLARTRREPVNIADQGYHDPSPRYCRSGKAIVADPCPGIGRSGGPANRSVRMCFQTVPCIRSPAGHTYAMALAATSAMTAFGGNTTLWAMRGAVRAIQPGRLCNIGHHKEMGLGKSGLFALLRGTTEDCVAPRGMGRWPD
jgi:hypothetical protein